VGPLFFEDTITAKNYPNILTPLLYWRRINVIAGFSKVGRPPILRKQQQLSCRTSSVVALLSVALGHCDPQTLHHLTSVCRDFFKTEPTATTWEAWRTLNVTLNRLLPILTKKLFEELQKTLWNVWLLIFKKVGDIFSICCNYSLFITFCVSLKK
jgi:hypothetical protein